MWLGGVWWAPKSVARRVRMLRVVSTGVSKAVVGVLLKLVCYWHSAVPDKEPVWA